MIKSITQFYIKLAYQLDKADAEFLPLVARLIFGFTLLGFFWRAGLTKLGEGASKFFMPSSGAYAQILPQKFEAVGYDQSGMSILDWLVVMAGTYGEFILPLLIIIGFATRAAALGMIVFILVMSLVDVSGHGVVYGSLLDANPVSLIPDQRLYWCAPMLILIFKGPGSISCDYLLCRFMKSKALRETR